jgi:MFS family permease
MAEANPRSEACTGRDVRDVYGRGYLPGPGDRELLGLSRAWVARAAWAAMLAVSCTQYGYGAFAARLGRGERWDPEAVAWGFVLWITCQSAASGALPWLRRRLGLTPRTAVTAGAAGCAIGLLGLGRAGDPAVALTAYGVIAGLGAGLVYGSCVAVVAAWYPDRPARTAVVSGAFGYGAIPVILIVAEAGDPAVSCSVLAYVIVAVAALCAPLLREPPRRWRPAGLDPRRRAVDKALNPVRRQDPPAVREHSPSEVARNRAARVMATLAFSIWAVALFDTAYLPSFGLASGWGRPDSAIALAAFAAGSGGVRTLAVGMAGRIGRPRAVVAATSGGAIAQLALAVAGSHHALALFWLAACGAGAAAGTWYALLPGYVRSFSGGRTGRPNLWLVYSAKAAGGVLGVGCAGWLARAVGYPPALIASGVLALSGAALVPLLRSPGLPRTLPSRPPPAVVR